MIEFPETGLWHINADWIVIASKNGVVMLLKVIPDGEVELEWKISILRAMALGHKNSDWLTADLQDVIVTTSGCVLIDSTPKDWPIFNGLFRPATSMFSKRGKLMWSILPGVYAGKAFVKGDTIFRLEFDETLACHFTARDVLHGAILYVVSSPLLIHHPY